MFPGQRQVTALIGYGAIHGLLSTQSNTAKGVAPISVATIWAMEQAHAIQIKAPLPPRRHAATPRPAG